MMVIRHRSQRLIPGRLSKQISLPARVNIPEYRHFMVRDNRAGDINLAMSECALLKVRVILP